MVDELDLSELQASYGGRGTRPPPPRLLLKLVLLEMQNGRQSPAQWARDIRENDTLKWLGQGITPSRSQLYRFRDRLKDEWLQEWNAGVVRQAVVETQTTARHGSQDGTILAACASRHQLIRSEKLMKRCEQLRAAATGDQIITPPAPENLLPRWIAPTLRGRRQQLARYEHAARVMQQRQEENAKRPSDKRQLPEKIVISTGDPEAPLGRDKLKVFRPLYNIQCVCDRESDLVLAYDTFAQASDAGTLPPLLKRLRSRLGWGLGDLLADATYASLNDLRFCEQEQTVLYAPFQSNSFTHAKRAGKPRLYTKEDFTWSPVEQTLTCPRGHILRREGKFRRPRCRGEDVTVVRHRCPPAHCNACPVHELCTKRPQAGRTVRRLEGEELLDDLKTRMHTPEAKAIFRQRSATIERRFADAKHHRSWTRFHGRGLSRAKTETGLQILAHNLVTLDKLRQRRVATHENSS